MDGFSQYLQDIVRYPLLSKEQEILLARQVQVWVTSENPTPKQIKTGERAYQKLINCNLRLVVSIAKRYTLRSKRTEMFDIVQEGNIGLAHGIKKFDPERGYALSTYVYGKKKVELAHNVDNIIKCQNFGIYDEGLYDDRYL